MKRTLLTWFLLLCPAPLWAAVTVDACVSEAGALCTNCDVATLTVAADANYLIAFAGKDRDEALPFTSATWDFGGTAQAMTPLTDNNATGAVVGRAWGLANPTVGNKTLRFVVGTSTQCCDLSICSLKGVDTSNPTGTIVENESTATVAGDSLAFTLGSGGLAVGYLIGQGTFTSFASGANQTEQFSTTTHCSGGDCRAVVTTLSVSPLDYSWTNTSTNFWDVVIPLNAGTSRRPVAPVLLSWLASLLSPFTPQEAWAQ
jgi:hypothetical protein